MRGAAFTRTDSSLGEFALRRVDPAADAELLHGWLTHPKARFWQLQGATLDDVERHFADLASSATDRAFIGLHDGAPSFLTERYEPTAADVGERFDLRRGDVGMHVLVPHTDRPIHGFTFEVLVTVMGFLFSNPRTERVVVEPDMDNTPIHALNAAVGFEVADTVSLPTKRALVSTCTRERFARARRLEPSRRLGPRPGDLVAHLTSESWAGATRSLVTKALSEFAHERLLLPENAGPGLFRIRTDDREGEYRFAARRMRLDHWRIDPDTVTRHRGGEIAELDALAFVLEFRDTLGLDAEMLPIYLEEITSTVASGAFKLSARQPAAGELAGAGFQAIESAMTAGHPCFVANSGRLGFDAEEYLRYAPEAGATVRLVWLAAHRDRSTFSVSDELSYDTLIAGELDPQLLDRFTRVMRDRGLDLGDYHLLPVHPWQWWNRLAVTFAADLARGHLVCLGYGDDDYQPQQSVRTFFNTTDPSRHYVKTALSVQNMGFLRGLSAGYMEATPAINDWIASLVNSDDYLRGAGFSLLRERAAIGYRSEHYEAATSKGSPYLKMLAALWRESPVPTLRPDERLATMASLLHKDRAGSSLAGALIAESGLSAPGWLRSYLDAYLAPILHCFYAYDLAFMPHGENLILVLENGIPRRAFMKDIGEEAVVMSETVALPPAVERIRTKVPDHLKLLSIFTDVLDSFLRFLADVLVTDGWLDEDTFWSTVAGCVGDYQDSMPHLDERFAAYDIFCPRFELSCLNRLQLRDARQMVDLADPAGGLLLAGTLDNPLAPWRRRHGTP